jgi:hypothetical protein
VLALFVDYDLNTSRKHKIDFFTREGYNIDELKDSDRPKYNKLNEKYFAELREQLPNWIVTDVRFPNEADAIKARGGLLVRVTRKGHEFTGKHPSEIALDDYDNFNITIENNGTIDDLIKEVQNKIMPLI